MKSASAAYAAVTPVSDGKLGWKSLQPLPAASGDAAAPSARLIVKLKKG